MSKLLRTWGPSALWAVVLFLLSAWPDAPEPFWFPLSDKVVHLCLYAVLGAALAYGARSSGPSPPDAFLVVLGSLYGASDEWHQSFVPGRDPSAWDWAADNVGLLLGYVLFFVLVGRKVESSTGGRDTAATHDSENRP